MRQLNVSKAKSDAGGSAGDDQAAGIFQRIKSLISDELVQSVNGVFQFKLSGDGDAEWYLDLKNGQGMLKHSRFKSHIFITCLDISRKVLHWVSLRRSYFWLLFKKILVQVSIRNCSQIAHEGNFAND